MALPFMTEDGQPVTDPTTARQKAGLCLDAARILIEAARQDLDAGRSPGIVGAKIASATLTLDAALRQLQRPEPDRP